MSYKSYRDDKRFIEVVEKKDFFAVKSNLEDLIVSLEGDEEKCNEAVQYAIEKGAFKWEEDDGIYFGESAKTVKEKYAYEKGRLVQNFTKERYKKVLGLYREVFSKRISQEKEEQKKNTHQTEYQTDQNGKLLNFPQGKKKKNSKEKEDPQKRIFMLLAAIVIIVLIVKMIF